MYFKSSNSDKSPLSMLVGIVYNTSYKHYIISISHMIAISVVKAYKVLVARKRIIVAIGVLPGNCIFWSKSDEAYSGTEQGAVSKVGDDKMQQ